jgi:hypothetical protein
MKGFVDSSNRTISGHSPLGWNEDSLLEAMMICRNVNSTLRKKLVL